MSLLSDILTPSARDETPYLWAVIATGHLLLGAAFAWCWPIALALYALKEAHDLAYGGRWRDGLADTGMVAVGLTYSGPWWWPVLALAGICAGALLKQRNLKGTLG